MKARAARGSEVARVTADRSSVSAGHRVAPDDVVRVGELVVAPDDVLARGVLDGVAPDDVVAARVAGDIAPDDVVGPGAAHRVRRAEQVEDAGIDGVGAA